jgi:hypothetical protein
MVLEMTLSDYMELAVRGSGISLVTYAIIGQVVKPGLRLLAKRAAGSTRLSRGQEEFYRWLTRALCVVIGGLIGLLSIWPDWLQTSWGPLIGCISGSMAPGIYIAVSKALPDRLRKIISGASITGGSE